MGKLATPLTTHRHFLRAKQIVPEALFVASGQIVATAGNIFGIRVFTTLLHPDAYGKLALALTGATLAQQLILGPITTAGVRYFAPAAEKRDLNTYVRSILTLFAGASLLLFTISAVLEFCLWLNHQSEWLATLTATVIFAWLSSASSMLDGIQDAARQRLVVAFHQGAGAWLRLGLVVAMARVATPSSIVILYSYSAGYLLLAASQLSFLHRTLIRSGFERSVNAIATRPMILSMCRYSGPFAIWGTFTWIQSSSDR